MVRPEMDEMDASTVSERMKAIEECSDAVYLLMKEREEDPRIAIGALIAVLCGIAKHLDYDLSRLLTLFGVSWRLLTLEDEHETRQRH